jgi:hypothetical protein
MLVINELVDVSWISISLCFFKKNCKRCVLSQFRVRKFLLNHVIVSLKTEIILLLNSSGSELDIIILVSSANNIGWANFFELIKSVLLYYINIMY